VLHLADHDPNGIDMTRDNKERLSMFAGTEIEVRRIALNMDQVRRYNPPPNPAKVTDTRFLAYAEKLGDQSWELDALSPTVIDGLIRSELDFMIDLSKWKKREAAERRNRTLLDKISKNWAKVKKVAAS
jgi:hypothetical protein